MPLHQSYQRQVLNMQCYTQKFVSGGKNIFFVVSHILNNLLFYLFIINKVNSFLFIIYKNKH